MTGTPTVHFRHGMQFELITRLIVFSIHKLTYDRCSLHGECYRNNNKNPMNYSFPKGNSVAALRLTFVAERRVDLQLFLHSVLY